MSNIKTLKERAEHYETISDYKLLDAVPKIILINGRSFSKTTSLLKKPFSPELLELMCGTMIKLVSEIDGAIFAYGFNDEIVIVYQNNIFQDQWYNGNVQKISSSCAALATYEFNKLASENKVELFGDPIFTANVFNIPNTTEVINFLIAKQQQAFHSALSQACFYELLKNNEKWSSNKVKEVIIEKTAQEKVDMLFEKCGIEFENYPLYFRRGFACFRIPKFVNDEIKNKITIEMELPSFTKDTGFLPSIFREK